MHQIAKIPSQLPPKAATGSEASGLHATSPATHKIGEEGSTLAETAREAGWAKGRSRHRDPPPRRDGAVEAGDGRRRPPSAGKRSGWWGIFTSPPSPVGVGEKKRGGAPRIARRLPQISKAELRFRRPDTNLGIWAGPAPPGPAWVIGARHAKYTGHAGLARVLSFLVRTRSPLTQVGTGDPFSLLVRVEFSL